MQKTITQGTSQEKDNLYIIWIQTEQGNKLTASATSPGDVIFYPF